MIHGTSAKLYKLLRQAKYRSKTSTPLNAWKPMPVMVGWDIVDQLVEEMEPQMRYVEAVNYQEQTVLFCGIPIQGSNFVPNGFVEIGDRWYKIDNIRE